jgi:hypothetical protein
MAEVLNNIFYRIDGNLTAQLPQLYTFHIIFVYFFINIFNI